ncbi:hypothetical protein CPB84DRAFT_1798779 [Gymnopilus junonius]|uniref:Uncharacterized protein n=1 Tax=Gymnopilus junonius TaxID=109634 RepID=A0A9P5TFZ6_GYMJU|nr:hypothetical protein CPB84DRAFT_1798779 [Gymnopilus junonius]
MQYVRVQSFYTNWLNLLHHAFRPLLNLKSRRSVFFIEVYVAYCFFLPHFPILA